VATGAGVGLLPGAPGTYGAALAIPIFVLLSPLPAGVLVLSWAALLALGTWAADGAERTFGREDDGRIVIDEVVGQLLTLAPLLPAGAVRSPLWLVTGFVAFRVFDIWKPGPVRRAEQGFSGGLGVMMDDVVAGAAGAGVLGVLLLATRLAGGSPW
jgi:phosphatidylglycerophosphatase A